MMHWEQDPQTGEWVYTDDLDPTASPMAGVGPAASTVLLADEPALPEEPPRYGPPTAGEEGGPYLDAGPIFEFPEGEEPPGAYIRPKDPYVRPPAPRPEYDEGGYSHPDMGFLPVEPEIVDPESEAGVERYPIDGVERGRYGPDEWSPIRPAVPDSRGGYDNIDHARIRVWEEEARARGNEVRYTVSGTFEVDADGRIVSTMPSPYKIF